MLETTPAISTALEFSVGAIVPILQHSGCSSSSGTVTRLDDLGKPKEIKCIKPLCHRRVIINWRQVQIK